ncbi:hypothetical protein ACSHT2_13920 [Bradyrhizobium sp. PUT101]|uniref:hypothetical protein n=1 Tax=Bradyrhizobium sp. PUT101 TaxID=3447427 RepID=UPI003F855BB0
MTPNDEPPPPKPAPKPTGGKARRMEEALRNIEEYADDLRELIRKLRRRLH